MLKNVLLGMLAAASIADAMATPVTFTANTSITQYRRDNGAGDGLAFDTLLPDGSTLTLDPGYSDTFLDVAVSGGSFGVANTVTNALKRFTAGEIVNGASLMVSSDPDAWAYALDDGQLAAGWDQAGPVYLGFVTGTGLYGYVAANWTFDDDSATLSLGEGVIQGDANDVLVVPGAVPEPATLSLIGLGLLGAGLVRSRRRS